jgi:hypothetical protein
MRFRFLDAIRSTPARMFLLAGQDPPRQTRDEGETMRYIFCDTATNASEAVWDRELREEIEFHRRREPEASIRVRVTDVATSPRQEFAALRKLNEVMRKFWAEH